VELYGIIGAATATCCAYVIGNILIINWYYHRRIGIDIPLFWKNILRMSPVMIIMGTGAFFLLDAVCVDNWLTLFVAAGVYTIAYMILSYFFMMNAYEKEVIKTPLMKIFRCLRATR
jgi:O-antigen/teichoic acid export membrane protein